MARKPVMVRWIVQAPAWGDPDAVVWVDMVTFDASWRRSDHYLARGGANGIGDRYHRVGIWIGQGGDLFMPQVTLCDAVIAFSDGRHRVAWLRDHGATALPVQVNPALVTQFKALCPTNARVTTVDVGPRIRLV